MKELAGSQAITADELMKHIKTLASDEFAGRKPGSEGEEKTLDYFDRYYRDLASRSGRSFEVARQRVPARRILSKPNVAFKIGNQQWTLDAPREYFANTKQTDSRVEVTDSEIVFVGYGIEAKEYEWDDYKGLDVAGKTLIMLCGDPIHDPEIFRGRELTYYGRWTYKYEIAGAKQATAVFIVHETDRAGYGWDVVTHSFGQEGFALQHEDTSKCARVDGWLSRDAAIQLFQLAGLDYENCKQQALSREFKPIALQSSTCAATIESTFANIDSYNSVAVLRGSDPSLADEGIIYTAHWDHFGVTADGIISGAVDNATGVASVLEVAKAFAYSPPERRSVVFFLPTLEEQNLLGSKHYVRHPTLPIEKTLAVLNFEMMNPWGRSTSISSVCMGHTSLDDLLREAASQQGKTVVPDPEPEKGYMYRSDHLPFMRAGIPGLALFFSCMNHLDRRAAYIRNDYHKPTDKPNADWDLSGAAEETRLFFEVGMRVLKDGYRAKWNPKSEFATAN